MEIEISILLVIIIEHVVMKNVNYDLLHVFFIYLFFVFVFKLPGTLINNIYDKNELFYYIKKKKLS